MIRKLILYFQVLYEGEFLKKIEYKIKDWTGYFYLRQVLTIKTKKIKLNNININLDNLNKNNFKQTYNYKIFNKNIKYEDILTKINCNKEFWRKIKISKYDDIKIPWEYNRLQFLLPISINYLKTGDYKYKKLINDILESWNNNNPFEYSLNWNSNLEVSIRAINISLLLFLLNDSNLNNKYSNLLYLHAKHIYNEINFSDKCIPNNHVIGEATALLMLSRIIDINENKKWYNKSIKILEKYCNIIDDDGVSEENSFSYQLFVTKMYMLSLCFVKETELYNKILNLIRRSLSFQKYTIANEKEIFNYGDNDDGFLYSFDAKYNIVDDIDRYYNFFYNEKGINDFEILFYKCVYDCFQKSKFIIEKDKNQNNYFSSNKIFIYKNEQLSICFNAKKITGHAHNDSLGVILYINGYEVLCDSGTYSYNLSKKLRDFYRGRESHSTIILDDNAIPIKMFRWKNKENSMLKNIITSNNILTVEGNIGKKYKRKIKIYLKENKISIIDSIDSDYIYTSWIFSKKIILKDNFVYCPNATIHFVDNPIDIKKQKIDISKRYLNKKEGIQIMKVDNKKSETIIEW